MSLERATALREEMRHNSTAILLLFINWIVVALKALCQIRVRMCKPLKQTQPPTTAIQTMVPQGAQDPAKLLSRKSTTFFLELFAIFFLGFVCAGFFGFVFVGFF